MPTNECSPTPPDSAREEIRRGADGRRRAAASSRRDAQQHLAAAQELMVQAATHDRVAEEFEAMLKIAIV